LSVILHVDIIRVSIERNKLVSEILLAYFGDIRAFHSPKLPEKSTTRSASTSIQSIKSILQAIMQIVLYVKHSHVARRSRSRGRQSAIYQTRIRI